MASKILAEKATSPKATAQTSIQKYEKGGTSFIVEAIGNTNYKMQVINKGPKKLALLFGLDESGDHTLTNMLLYLREYDPPAFNAAMENMKVFLKQLKSL